MVPPLIRLTRGVPPAESFPVEQIKICAEAVLDNDAARVLQYGKARGYPPLREIIAREMDVDPEQIVVGQGSLQLQDLVARMLVRPGDVVYVEEPTYDRTLTLLRRAGAHVIGFPLAADGPDVEAMEDRLKKGERPVLFYVIPDFQNPSGTVMARWKRERIAQMSREYGFWILEDAPYRKLRYRGEDLPALWDLAPERVIQLSSYSKLISPGLRVGYAIVPEALADDLAKTAEDTYINASYLNQAIVAEFIRRGWLEEQLARLRTLYLPRLDATMEALDAHMKGLATWYRVDGGFFLGITLNHDVRADDLLRAAQEANLRLTDGRGFFANGGGDGFVRLPFCSLTPEEIREGIGRLASVVRALVG